MLSRNYWSVNHRLKFTCVVIPLEQLMPHKPGKIWRMLLQTLQNWLLKINWERYSTCNILPWVFTQNGWFSGRSLEVAAYQNQQTRGFLWEEVSIMCFLDDYLWPAVYKVWFHVVTESSCYTLSGVVHVQWTETTSRVKWLLIRG